MAENRWFRSATMLLASIPFIRARSCDGFSVTKAMPVFGALTKPALAGLRDMGPREIFVFAPLVILTILFGVYPKPVLDMSAASVTALLDNYQHALGAAKSAALAK